ncbi:MAG: epimerase [Isosphaeraceae bacterium]|jgi:uncharacterized protein (TIGR01777 family)|nr:MAG: epimerase [Isosphaeraceae bacterium]
MRVFVTGGTGLIGRRLVRRLAERGDTPVVLTRRPAQARRHEELRGVELIEGDPMVAGSWQEHVHGCDAVIHLAGENIFGKRWDPEVKRLIRDSRVYGTGQVVAAIARAERRPAVLVQGSAIGYYGTHGDEELDESSPSGTDFMAVVCREWEDAARPVEDLGVRLAVVRTGIVLALGEGALGVMTPIFKLPGGAAPVGSGANPFLPGSGRQWMSWIHLEDIVGIFLLAIDHAEARGPINGTSPNPVRNADFAKALASVLWKPYAPWRIALPIGPPDVLLRLILGEVADVVAKGQRVLPRKAQALGYSFLYPELLGALREIFGVGEGERSPASAASAS